MQNEILKKKRTRFLKLLQISTCFYFDFKCTKIIVKSHLKKKSWEWVKRIKLIDDKKQRFWRAELEDQRELKTTSVVMRTYEVSNWTEKSGKELELKFIRDYEMFPWCGNVNGLENRKTILKIKRRTVHPIILSPTNKAKELPSQPLKKTLG